MSTIIGLVSTFRLPLHFSLLLDFLLPPLRFKVQSATLARSFWTSSHLPATSKSNPQLLLAPFGLPRISPPLQSPFCHSFSLLLDFLLPPLHFKVQSAALARSFWTSSCLPSASKSIPPLLLAPFGLPRISPLPQSPIRSSPAPHHAKKADCKSIRQSHSGNSNPPVQFHYFYANHQPIPPSKAPAISATSESGTRTYLPSGTNHFPIGLSAPALTASTANFFPATQKNIIAASIAPSGQI